MSLRKPPRLAVWLLKRCGVSERNEALAGDLAEEFRSGRSAGWFWRQTLTAVITGKPELRALLIIWVLQLAAAWTFLEVHGPVSHVRFFPDRIVAFASLAIAVQVPEKFYLKGYWRTAVVESFGALLVSLMTIVAGGSPVEVLWSTTPYFLWSMGSVTKPPVTSRRREDRRA